MDGQLHLPSPEPRDRGVALTLRARDGFPLAVRVFDSVGPARGTIVVQGATGAPQRYYRAFARHCQRRGFRVVTFDYRGIGESRVPAGGAHSVTMGDWGTLDADAVHRFVEARYREPTWIVGHSFGGQALALFDLPPRVRGVVLVAAQLSHFGHWPFPSSLALSLFWRVVLPAVVALAGRLPRWVGFGELPAGAARQWARFCLHPESLLGEFPEGHARLSRLTLPVLSYRIADDWIAPPGAVAAFHRCLPRVGLRQRELTPRALGQRAIGHFGFFRPALSSQWDEVLAHFERVEAGFEVAPMEHATPPEPSLLRAILLDLEYGRD